MRLCKVGQAGRHKNETGGRKKGKMNRRYEKKRKVESKGTGSD